MSLSEAAVELLPSVEKFMTLVAADPTSLNDPRASNVKVTLEKLGANIPATPKESRPSSTMVPEAVDGSVDEDDNERINPESEPFPVMPESEGDDWEGAGSHKETANGFKANGDYNAAVDAFTKALMCQQSALTYANRADCLLKLKRPSATVADCDAALKINPDSAKALKIKGKALRFLGQYEDSHIALAKAMAIDFDPDLQEMFKFVSDKAKSIQEKKTELRVKEQEEAKKRKEEDRARARKEAAERASQSAKSSTSGGMGGMPGGMGGMPGGMGGMPGGMGGMPGGMPAGMADIMNDPEIVAGLSNPKVMSVLQGMMGGDTSGMAAAMSDPEVGPILMKLQQKMGGMGGMPGGMGGMPGGMGGMPGGMGGIPGGMGVDEDNDDLDDLPDLDEVPDLD